MTDTATRFQGPALLSGSAATVYTVPALTTAILRNIHAANTDSSARTLTVSIGSDAAGTRLLPALSIPAAGTYDWSGFIVLTAAEIVQAYSDSANKVALTISGVAVT